MNKKDFKAFFKEAIKNFKNGCEGVMFYELGNGLYYVVGWDDGFDEDVNDCLSDGTYHVCGKIAYNCSDLQCDFEWDWEMPIDTESGDVYDTDNVIDENDNVDKLYDYIKKEYKNIVSELKHGTLKFCD